MAQIEHFWKLFPVQLDISFCADVSSSLFGKSKPVMMDETKSKEDTVPIYDEYTPQDENVPHLPPIVITHAILDCKINWKAVATALAENTKRKVYVLDVPDHDDDDPPQDISLDSLLQCAQYFLIRLGEPVILIGHSVGAIIGILIATKQPQLINQLVIIDISPVNYPLDTEEKLMHSTKVMREALSQVPKGLTFIKTQNAIRKFFEKTIPFEVIRRMLLTNLKEGKNRIRWRCDLDAIDEEFKKTKVSDYYPLKCLCYTKTLLIYGDLSNFVIESDFPDMKVVLPNLKMHCVKGANHWIHLEQPEKLIQAITDFLLEEK